MKAKLVYMGRNFGIFKAKRGYYIKPLRMGMPVAGREYFDSLSDAEEELDSWEGLYEELRKGVLVKRVGPYEIYQSTKGGFKVVPPGSLFPLSTKTLTEAEDMARLGAYLEDSRRAEKLVSGGGIYISSFPRSLGAPKGYRVTGYTSPVGKGYYLSFDLGSKEGHLTFLHELGHIELGHASGKRSLRDEEEAWNWAIKYVRGKSPEVVGGLERAKSEHLKELSGVDVYK